MAMAVIRAKNSATLSAVLGSPSYASIKGSKVSADRRQLIRFQRCGAPVVNSSGGRTCLLSILTSSVNGYGIAKFPHGVKRRAVEGRQRSRTVIASSLDDGRATTSSSSDAVYQGVYGPWIIEPSDVREVILYRTGLVTAAASFVIAASMAFLPGEAVFLDKFKQNVDFFYILGAGGLGLSLFLIHIYVTEIKRTLQALWALGVVGSLAAYLNLARPADESLLQYVVDHPIAVWFVGPVFASLTGLVFKEGLCYGKLEAGILTFIIPSVLLGHLSGVMDDNVKLSLLALWMALFVIFAGRKFTQPVKDDIGDKSVFMFNALPEEEKKAVIQKLEQGKIGQDFN